jgi:hypothetical protein
MPVDYRGEGRFTLGKGLNGEFDALLRSDHQATLAA